VATPLPHSLYLFLSYISSQSSSGSQFSAIGEFKTLVGAEGLILGTCIILPCFLPLVIRSIRFIIEATMERWKYKPLNKENAL
jgi:ABC-type tungstate transport system substrate-binding protein